MEALLQYTWKHKMFPLTEMTTTDGQQVEVIDPGLHNRGSGPDFFNAKIRIGSTLWVGNIEMHVKASDWYVHHHEEDEAYNNVVLHVVEVSDRYVQKQNGEYIPQMVLEIPASVRTNYGELLSTDAYPPCYRIIPSLTRLMLHSWMSALQTERLERKTTAITARADALAGNWEDAYFCTLARNYGFGTNSEAMEQWSRTVNLQAAAHHRDDVFQVQALFLGQAGLLTAEGPRKPKLSGIETQEAERLRSEYRYLKHKFALQEMPCSQWIFRTRPQNAPHHRLMQLAQLYCERRTSLRELIECKEVSDVAKLYDVKGNKLNLLMINTVVPMLFAYGRHTGKQALCDRAFDLLESLPAEDNTIVRMWSQCGFDVKTAGDSQALIQLKREYCDRRDCLRCRIGYEYMKL